MRVCDLNTLFIDGGAGGANTYLREKARYFTEMGGAVEHHLIVPAGCTERRRLFGSTLHAIRSPRLPQNPQHRLLVHFPLVRRILQDLQPDVVEVDCSYLLGHVAASALSRRRVLLVGYYHVHLPVQGGTAVAARAGFPLRAPLGALVERFAWRYLEYCMSPLARIFVTARDVLDRLSERGFDRLVHVPMGVNLDLFRPEGRMKATDGERTILYVGRMSEEKDLPVLFQAFDALSRERSGLRLRVVGGGPMQAVAERFAAGRSDVVVHGHCPYGPELASHYASADVLAMPSRYETFGLAILEALACGVPVVAAAEGGPRDIIRPAVGALARPNDPADLAAKLAGVLDRAPPARRCRRRVEEKFSWSRTFARLLEVYSGTRTRSVPKDRPVSMPAPTLRGVGAGTRRVAGRSTVGSLPTGGVP